LLWCNETNKMKTYKDVIDKSTFQEAEILGMTVEELLEAQEGKANN